MKLLPWGREIFATIHYDCTHIDWRSNRIQLAIKAAIAVPFAIWLAWMLNLVYPNWAGFSAFVVLQASSGATLTKALDRILSTILAIILVLCVFYIFNENLFFLLAVSFIIISVGLYIVRKTDKPYAWMLGLVTFAMVMFGSSGMTPVAISSEAYYRGVEIILGTLCAVGISLIFPVHVKETVVTNNHRMIDMLEEVYCTTLARYQFNKSDAKYATNLRALSDLADAQTQLRRFIEQETLLIFTANQSAHLIDQFMHSSYEVLGDLYYRYSFKSSGLETLFQPALKQLEQAFKQAFKALHEFIDNQISFAMFQERLIVVEQAINFLIDSYHAEREKKINLAQVNLAVITQWQQFISSQQSLYWLLKNLCRPRKKVSYLSLPARLKNIFEFDYYYLVHGIKGALVSMGLVLLALELQVPVASASLIGVIILFTIQLDDFTSVKLNCLMVVGFLIGSIIAILIMSLNLETLWIYLLIIAIPICFAAYLAQGPLTYNIIGPGIAIAIIVGVANVNAPIVDWRPQILALMSMGLGLVAFTIFVSWIWPFSDQDKIKHQMLQLQRYRYLLQQQLLNAILKHSQTGFMFPISMRKELNNFRLLIKGWATLDIEPEVLTKFQFYRESWQQYYYTLSELLLSAQRLNLCQEMNDAFPVLKTAQIILDVNSSMAELKAAQLAIKKWLVELRLRSLHGATWLPMQTLLNTISFLLFLSALVDKLQEIERQTQILDKNNYSQ